MASPPEKLTVQGWVVLRAQPRRELLAAEAIRAKGVESYVPLLPPRRRSEAARPLFPGYLFARVTVGSDELLRIRSIAGVAYVLPRADSPSIVPDGVIDAIRARLAVDGHILGGERLRPGDRVSVVSGPFRWVEAIFDRRLNAAGRVRVLLDFVYRSVSMEMDEQNLRRIE